MDTSNEQIVGVCGDLITVLAPKTVMTRQAALLFAAWLVALADKSEGFRDFHATLNAVEQA